MTLEQTIDTLVQLALAEDLNQAGDVTSQAILEVDALLHAEIVAKMSGVVAGLPVVSTVYQRVDPAIEIAPQVHDGDRVEAGTIVCTFEGRAQSLLTGERTALNFLQHLSGVASLTRQFVDAVQGTQAVILDTRKTTPGWRLLEKYAVRMGGGRNHRIGLYDAVMIKDNHIAAAGGITAAVEQVRAYPKVQGLPITLEVESLDQLAEALNLNVDQILLDNMDNATMHRAVEITAGRVPLEASGDMSLQRVASVAATGVNFISVGALTHSAPAFDFSMRLY